MVTLFYVLFVISLVGWVVVYPCFMTLKGKDPFVQHPFRKWRFLEHQLVCALGASVTGLILYAIFAQDIPRTASEMVWIILFLSFVSSLLSWAWTRGAFTLVPNPLDLSKYLRFRWSELTRTSSN